MRILQKRLITRRSRVRIPPPLLRKDPHLRAFSIFRSVIPTRLVKVEYHSGVPNGARKRRVLEPQEHRLGSRRSAFWRVGARPGHADGPAPAGADQAAGRSFALLPRGGWERRSHTGGESLRCSRYQSAHAATRHRRSLTPVVARAWVQSAHEPRPVRSGASVRHEGDVSTRGPQARAAAGRDRSR